MYNNKYNTSLKGYFKSRFRGLSHEESLKYLSNSKIKRKISYKIRKEINKNCFVFERKTFIISVSSIIISLILVGTLIINIWR